MPTYLDICEDVARESGTVPATGTTTAFSTVVGVTGRQKRIAYWVARSWHDIQTSQDWWRWLQTPFTGSLSSGAQTYTAAAMGINSRFGRWICELSDATPAFSIWKTADGQDTETLLRCVDRQVFRRHFQRGGAASETGYPTHYTEDEQGRLVFWPTPDAPYTVAGFYYKGPQDLQAGASPDDNVPECPERYHKLIELRALLRLMRYDEAPEMYPLWREDAENVEADLLANELPPVRMGEPLV